LELAGATDFRGIVGLLPVESDLRPAGRLLPITQCRYVPGWGKGFAGVIKRHHFGGQNASHGNSISHRVPGSTGQNQSPAHVFKGKRMPGHLGNARRTISKLEIVRIDAERQLLLVKGSVPGSSGRDVVVQLAAKGQRAPVKAQAPKAAPKAEPKAAPKPDAKAAAKPAAKPQPAPKA